VSRLRPVKNLGLLIDAMEQLSGPLKSRAHLVIAGRGGEEEKLRNHARAKGLQNRVHLVGNRSDVGAWCAAFDVFVNCSLSEGMSQSILEAMAFGLPMVVTDVGDNARLVGGESPCGLVVPSGDRVALARAIESVLDDPQAQARMICCARDRHQAHYSVDTMIETYEEFYTQVQRGVCGPKEAALL
jgi:glycosyltransferase involved in cell wall biosynthesis